MIEEKKTKQREYRLPRDSSPHFPSLSSSLIPLIFSDEDPSGIPLASLLFALHRLRSSTYVAGRDRGNAGIRSARDRRRRWSLICSYRRRNALNRVLLRRSIDCRGKEEARAILIHECLRAELRSMAPPNGRAVLLFRSRCGFHIAKLEGWGPKRARRHKKLNLPFFDDDEAEQSNIR